MAGISFPFVAEKNLRIPFPSQDRFFRAFASPKPTGARDDEPLLTVRFGSKPGRDPTMEELLVFSPQILMTFDVEALVSHPATT